MKNRIFTILASITVIYALLGFMVLPMIIQSQAQKQLNNLLNAQTTLHSVSFNPFTFKLKLNGFTIQQEQKELVKFDELYVDFSLLKSLHKLHVGFKEIRLSQLVVNVVQNEDGNINLLSLLKEQKSTPKQEVTDKNTQSSIIPFKISKTVLDNATFNVSLQNGDKPINVNLSNLNYTFHDLGTYKNSLASHSLNTKLNNDTTIKVNGGFYIQPFKMYGNIDIKNIHTNDYLPYKQALLNFNPSDALVDIDFGYQVDLNKELSAKIENFNVKVKDLNLFQHNKAFAGFKQFSINDATILYPQQTIDINSIQLDNLFAHAIMDKKGELNFANLVQQQDGHRVKAVQEKRKKGEDIWNISLNDFNINNAQVKFDDHKAKMNLSTQNINVNINEVKLIGTQLNSKAVNVGFEKLNLHDKKSNNKVYAKDYNLKLTGLEKNQETVKIKKINVQQKYASVNNKDAKIIARNINLTVDELLNKGNYIKVKKSLLNQPKLAITVKKKPDIKQENKKAQTVKKNTKKQKEDPKQAMNLDFGPFKINKANIVFEDKNLPIPFKSNISKLNGNFSELITKSTKPTKLKLEGQVDQYGYTKITGFVDHKNIKNLTDVQLLFKNIAIENFTPYSGKFVGRELDGGKLNLNLKYNITRSNIDAKNSIVITDIKLGKRIENPDAMDLPLELAIALMEDTNGVIDLNIPITGNVDDPKFSIAPIVWKAFTNLIVKAITSPFRFLASLFDFDEEELKSLEFAYGNTTLIASEKETLDKIAQIFAKRPKIALKVQAAYNSIEDTKALQNQKFEAFINEEIKKIKKGEDKYLIALEKNYLTYKEVKPLKELKKAFKNKDDKFDPHAYAAFLKEFLVNKQIVLPKELESLAQSRSNSIITYMQTAHNVDKSRIQISEKIMDETKIKEWVPYNLEIGLKQ